MSGRTVEGLLRVGTHTLEGRAWSGHGPVTEVQVTVDGGATWNRGGFANSGLQRVDVLVPA